MVKKKNILVFAAHPDDEVLGCGGTISKLSKNYNINVVFFTDGVGSRPLSKKKLLIEIKKRKKSAYKAAKILGFKIIDFLNFPDNQLDSLPLLKITKIIEKFINQLKPMIVFTHREDDLNIDHQIISRALITATRPQKKIFFLKRVLFFNVPSSSEWYFNGISKNKNKEPNWYYDISKTYNKKLKALKAYNQEIKKIKHPRSLKSIKNNDSYRGSIIGVDFAEAFFLGRNID